MIVSPTSRATTGATYMTPANCSSITTDRAWGRFTGPPGDGCGHINQQLNNDVPPCTLGYEPKKDWLPATDTTDRPFYPARCLSGAPYNQRGSKYAPEVGAASRARYRVAPYDARTGQVDDTLTLGRHTVFGDRNWLSMLIGPTEQR